MNKYISPEQKIMLEKNPLKWHEIRNKNDHRRARGLSIRGFIFLKFSPTITPVYKITPLGKQILKEQS